MQPTLASKSAIVVITSVLLHKKIQDDLCSHWKLAECRVVKDLSSLHVTDPVKEYLLNLCLPICKEIQKWCLTNIFLLNKETYPELQLQNILHWKPFGTIHYKQTAESVLCSSNDSSTNFRIACMYCFEKEIRRIWTETRPSFASIYPEPLEVQFWARCLQGDVEAFYSEMRSDLSLMFNDEFEFAFQLAVISNNHISAEYFLLRIKQEWQQRIIYRTVEGFLKTSACSVYMLKMLLFNLDEHARNKLLKMHPKTSVVYFLNWPLLHFLFDVVNIVWDSFDKILFYQLLQDISNYTADFYKSDIYLKVFEKIWHLGSSEFKNYVVSKFVYCSFFIYLAGLENTEYIVQLILSCAKREQKLEMIFSDNGIVGMSNLMRARRRGTVLMVFRECLPLELCNNWLEKYQKVSNDLNCMHIQSPDEFSQLFVFENSKML